MRQLTISNTPRVVVELQDEIRRSAESGSDHRLHGVLLGAQGMRYRQAAALLGDAPRTVEYWVHAFARRGLPRLQEGTEGPGNRDGPKAFS